MRRVYLLGFILGALQFSGTIIRAESSIDVLENELDQAKEQHESASSKQFTDFISALDKALQSQDEAIALYQSAGGDMPDPSPVYTTHDSETPDEKALRVAQDQAVDAAMATTIQLHCGVMRFAAYFVQYPNQQGLQDSWVAWLKHAAQMYPQAGSLPLDTRTVPPVPGAQKEGEGEGDNGGNGGAPPVPKHKKKAIFQDVAKALKDRAVRDSVISTYLNYDAWGDKEPGSWSVREIPRFYRTLVLDPLRANPSPATLAAWDAYIAMKSADEPDRDKWNAIDYPALQFQRACDDFYASPTDEKLEALVSLIKNNPTNPDLDTWIAQVKQMIEDFRTFKSTGTLPRPGAVAAAPPAAPAAPVPPAASAPAPTPAPAPAPAPTGT